MTVIQVNTIKHNEDRQKYKDLIKKHRMNIIVELPKLPEEEGETSQRLRRHISRAQECASVANKVYILGPEHNGYWPEWEHYCNNQNGYHATHHHWCGLGVDDKYTGKPVRVWTRILSNDPSLTDHPCLCCARDHISFSALRKQKNNEEQADYQSAPHQKAFSQWALSMIDILGLKPGGPRLNHEGMECYDTVFTNYKGEKR